MSTRAVLYLHTPDEKECNVDYTMKLYHHWDWYIDWWLWEDLVEMVKRISEEKNGSNSWDLRVVFEELAKVWWFEPTCWNHTDTEYIYHLTYDLGRWENWYEFKYKLEVQTWSDEWMEELNERKKYLMCSDWIWLHKEYNRDELFKEMKIK